MKLIDPLTFFLNNLFLCDICKKKIKPGKTKPYKCISI